MKFRSQSFSLSADPADSSRKYQPDEPAALQPIPSRWTFMTNHTHVLVVLSANPSIVLREVAARVGITERAVQRIIQELEQGGYIVRQKVGRQNNYQVSGDQNLRHPVVGNCTVQELLDLIAGR